MHASVEDRQFPQDPRGQQEELECLTQRLEARLREFH